MMVLSSEDSWMRPRRSTSMMSRSDSVMRPSPSNMFALGDILEPRNKECLLSRVHSAYNRIFWNAHNAFVLCFDSPSPHHERGDCDVQAMIRLVCTKTTNNKSAVRSLQATAEELRRRAILHVLSLVEHFPNAPVKKSENARDEELLAEKVQSSFQSRLHWQLADIWGANSILRFQNVRSVLTPTQQYCENQCEYQHV